MHTQTHTPPNEWSARRRGRYLHNTKDEHPLPQRGSNQRPHQPSGCIRTPSLAWPPGRYFFFVCFHTWLNNHHQQHRSEAHKSHLHYNSLHSAQPRQLKRLKDWHNRQQLRPSLQSSRSVLPLAEHLLFKMNYKSRRLQNFYVGGK